MSLLHGDVSVKDGAHFIGGSWLFEPFRSKCYFTILSAVNSSTVRQMPF